MKSVDECKRKCGNCFWFAAAPLLPEFAEHIATLPETERAAIEAQLEGECRREPPKAFLIGVAEGDQQSRIVQANPKVAQPGVRIVVTGGFPRVVKAKSCAMHEYAPEVDDFGDAPSDGRATRA